MKIDKGLIGGSVILLVLTLLVETDMYGYEIIKELDQRSDQTFQFKEGSLYPVLHKMLNSGYVSSYSEKGTSGKNRKYYQITTKGKKQLTVESEKWELFSSSVNKIVRGEVHAFV